MINEYFLSNSEKMSAFLDGELDTSETENLFFEVAKNPELQEEMRSLTTMKNAFRNSLIAPPPALKENILAGIGLAGPTEPTYQVGLWGRMLKSKALLSVCSLFIGAGATYLALNISPNDAKIASQPSDSGKPVVERNIPVSASFAGADLKPVTQSNIKSTTNINRNKNIVAVNRLTTVLDENDKIEDRNKNLNNDLTENSNPVPVKINNVYEFKNLDNSNIINTKQSLNSKFTIPNHYLSEESFAGFLKGLVLQIRGASSKSYPDVAVSPLSSPLLNNFGCALIYKVAQNDYVGLEIGQENFMQKYNGVEDFEKVQYDQNYLAFWYGAVYQHNFGSVYVFEPFAKVVAGGTKVGPLAKVTLGANFDVNDKFSIFGGLENSCLMYKFQSNVFTTFKVGATAGFSIKFN